MPKNARQPPPEAGREAGNRSSLMASEGTNSADLSYQTPSLQSCEMVHFCCLSHSVHGPLSRQPQETTDASEYLKGWKTYGICFCLCPPCSPTEVGVQNANVSEGCLQLQKESSLSVPQQAEVEAVANRHVCPMPGDPLLPLSSIFRENSPCSSHGVPPVS